MRTGSNLFEETINQVSGATCLGELFNPGFLGSAKNTPDLAPEIADRNKDPTGFWHDIKSQHAPSLVGFRYFNGHDQRILSHVLDDESCAKIVLRRSPLDSFLSIKIAQKTGQWRVRDESRRRSSKAFFDPAEFDDFRMEQSLYYETVFDTLKATGQTAFILAFDDILNLSVWKGLLRFLGLPQNELNTLGSLVRQNPEDPVEKVTNPKDVAPYQRIYEHWSATVRQVAPRIDPLKILANEDSATGFDLSNRFFEERLLSMHPGHSVLTQRQEIQDWQKLHPLHKVEFWLEHPLHRAYRCFDAFVVNGQNRRGRRLRRNLAHDADGNVLQDDPSKDDYVYWFEKFLRFLPEHLDGRSEVEPHPHWTYQHPNLTQLHAHISKVNLVVQTLEPKDSMPKYHGRFPLSVVTTEETLNLALAAYAPDTLRFGFSG